jgi:hypothetical protein
MSNIDRYRDPYQELSEIMREAQKQMQRPPKLKGGTQNKVTKIRQPDGTQIDVYEQTTVWEAEF